MTAGMRVFGSLVLGLLLMGGAGIGSAAPGGAESPQNALGVAVDRSACPGFQTEAELRADPLEGAIADDPLEDDPPPGFEAPPDPDAPAAPANPDLRPDLRPTGDGGIGALAVADAQAPAVELTLRWCVVQRNAGAELDWSAYDPELEAYSDPDLGLAIRSVRVVDAPRWAATETCVIDADRGDVDMCPPRLDREDELRAFARAAANYLGPNSTATDYDVFRFSFWNEPNTPENWGVPKGEGGGEAGERNRAERYSDRLAVFSGGVNNGDAAIQVDAGEVAAGSDGGDNSTRPWARFFARYNTDQGRNDRYQALTIHPYSEFAGQIPQKVANYRGLPGVNSVAVTEVAWGAADADDTPHWKCAANEGGQRTRFESLISAVRTTSTPIARLTWFSAVDNRKGEGTKCPTTHYAAAIRNQMNSYGLFRRPADGLIDSFAEATPRPLRDEFVDAQTP